MKARYALIISFLLLLVSIISMAVNHSSAASRATAIRAADASGQDTTLLRDQLKEYSAAHMAAATSVELTASYNKDVKAAQNAAGGAQATGQVYAQAQTACASKNDSIVQARCVAAYVAAHSTPLAQPKAAVLPDRSKYQYHYPSPPWSADLAGLSLSGAFISLFAAMWLWALHKF